MCKCAKCGLEMVLVQPVDGNNIPRWHGVKHEPASDQHHLYYDVVQHAVYAVKQCQECFDQREEVLRLPLLNSFERYYWSEVRKAILDCPEICTGDALYFDDMKRYFVQLPRHYSVIVGGESIAEDYRRDLGSQATQQGHLEMLEPYRVRLYLSGFLIAMLCV